MPEPSRRQRHGPIRRGERSARRGEAGSGSSVPPPSGCGTSPPRSGHPGLLGGAARIWAPTRAATRRPCASRAPVPRGDAANLCLLAAAVLSGCVLAGPAIQAMLGEPGLTEPVTLARARRAGARRARGALRLSGARGRPAAPLAQHARHAPRSRASTPFVRSRVARPPRARPPAGAGLALFCRHLFEDQRDWLVARAARHRISSDAPTAGAVSPPRSPSSAAVPPRSPRSSPG